MNKVTCINIKPAFHKISESHNERTGKVKHIIAGREDQHEHWSQETISSRLKKITEFYLSKVGQKLQITASPIREGVVIIKQETTMDELKSLGKALKERFDIDCFQIHIHKDEGRIVKRNEVKAAKVLEGKTLIEGELILNLHAHMIFDWQNKSTGRSVKLNKADTREMQTITAQVLGMVRGQQNSKAVRLEANEFKEFRERLNEDVAEELDKAEELKSKAHEELRLIEEQKKNSLLELKNLEAKTNDIKKSSKEFRTNYNQTLQELKHSREMLKKLDPKFELLRKLEMLPWSECRDNNVQAWLSLTHGFSGIRIKSGQDGSIYFQQGDQTARLKDMPKEAQTTIKGKLFVDKVFKKQEGIKWRKFHNRKID